MNNEMALSELLHPYLNMGCWQPTYEGSIIEDLRYYKCKLCGCWHDAYEEYGDLGQDNPNLFADWNGFGLVWDAVKKIEDFEVKFTTHQRGADGDDRDISVRTIASPDFQLAVLKWLLEKDNRLGELEEVMG